ncbi:hypothetical protein [Leptothrix discophora]|uniref:Uncharacterized protein n=1 Tax=Leptothrix discophora TaxID=89 RepID=A0ABT9G1J4_LEPDI|nr:hypothetical protein [Leptothrix discophora]MDP4300361.1 hypothetical protein [Leptothrix discophora]
MTVLVTLPDGRVFDARSALPRIFSAVRQAQVVSLRKMRSADERRAFIEHVERSEGLECGRALRAAYVADREARRDQSQQGGQG